MRGDSGIIAGPAEGWILSAVFIEPGCFTCLGIGDQEERP